VPLLLKVINFDFYRLWHVFVISIYAIQAEKRLSLFVGAGNILAKEHDLLIFITVTEIHKVKFQVACHRWVLD
jgi:hypothetical protein